MIDRITIADASKVSAADFLRHVRPTPQPSELHLLCIKLWEAATKGDRAEIRRIHEQIAGLQPIVDLEAKPLGNGRFGVAA